MGKGKIVTVKGKIAKGKGKVLAGKGWEIWSRLQRMKAGISLYWLGFIGPIAD